MMRYMRIGTIFTTIAAFLTVRSLCSAELSDVGKDAGFVSLFDGSRTIDPSLPANRPGPNSAARGPLWRRCPSGKWNQTTPW